MITLVLGGARSGKSRLAVAHGRAHEVGGGSVLFVATAPSDDVSMRERIDRHRRERPPWTTVEAPFDLVGALDAVDPDALVIVDCLTLWVSNLMGRGDAGGEIVAAAERLGAAAARRAGSALIISNEVGMGIHPATELGRDYRDVLGLVNQHLAAIADRAVLLVAGRAIELGTPIEESPEERP